MTAAYMDRTTFFGYAGLIQPVEMASKHAYEVIAPLDHLKDFEAAPHGHAWHTSFHASQFPGNDPFACGRRLLYTMMNIPRDKPANRAGRGVMAVGRAIEDEYVETWERAGVLLSAGVNAAHQTGFVYRKAWLTGNTDGILRPPGWDKGHVVEVKSKDGKVIDKMRAGEKGPDDAHIRQLKVYIALANIVSPFWWPHLKPVVSGSIYYISRERPENIAEFFFPLDMAFFEEGVRRLQAWRDDFLEDRLPPRNPSWKWSGPACIYCPFKNLLRTSPGKFDAGCKVDDKNKVTSLSKSTTIKWAQHINPDYDPADTRQAVLDRWGI